MPAVRLDAPHLVRVSQNTIFLEKIFNMIDKLVGSQIPRTPMVPLLNAYIPKIPKASRRLIHFLLLGAKLTVAKAWENQKISFPAVVRKVSWIMMQEKLSSILLDTASKFESIWEPWANHVGTPLTTNSLSA